MLKFCGVEVEPVGVRGDLGVVSDEEFGHDFFRSSRMVLMG